jgi:hypothetical protein
MRATAGPRLNAARFDAPPARFAGFPTNAADEQAPDNNGKGSQADIRRTSESGHENGDRLLSAINLPLREGIHFPDSRR